MTGGLRYSYDKKDGGGPYTVVVHGTPHPSPFQDNVSGSRLDWKVGVEANVAKHPLIYFNVQTGYNQGGFSYAPASIPDSTYPPEKLIAYTVGSKNRFFNEHLQFNIEGYYYKYSNYQVSARNLLTALDIIYPAQSAKVYGAQIDAAYLLSDSDRLTANLGLLHATATRLVLPASAGGANYSGYELPDAPPVTFRVLYRHNWNFRNGSDLAAEISENFIADQWESYNHALGTYQNGFHKTDVSLLYTPVSGRWSLQLWAHNLENKATYQSLVSAQIPGPGAGFIDPPRTYGITLSTHF